MTMFDFIDPMGFLLVLPAMALAMYAQFKVQSTFAKYLQVRARSGMTGARVARAILDDAGLHDVGVEATHGRLTDHYDPRSRTMRLSPDVYNGASVAALGVAAHETGHALQHAENYVPLSIRNQLFPVASFGSTLAMPLFLIGFIFTPAMGATFMNLGIWLFAAAVIFQLVTLPVEFDASSRAMRLLVDRGYIDQDEAPRTRKVLNAAALTYVAAAAVAAMQLIRLILLRNSRQE